MAGAYWLSSRQAAGVLMFHTLDDALLVTSTTRTACSGCCRHGELELTATPGMRHSQHKAVPWKWPRVCAPLGRMDHLVVHVAPFSASNMQRLTVTQAIQSPGVPTCWMDRRLSQTRLTMHPSMNDAERDETLLTVSARLTAAPVKTS